MNANFDMEKQDQECNFTSDSLVHGVQILVHRKTDFFSHS